MAGSVPLIRLLIQRRQGTEWRDMQEVADDHVAAEVARAVVAESPSQAVRIVMCRRDADGTILSRVLWEREGGLPEAAAGNIGPGGAVPAVAGAAVAGAARSLPSVLVGVPPAETDPATAARRLEAEALKARKLAELEQRRRQARTGFGPTWLGRNGGVLAGSAAVALVLLVVAVTLGPTGAPAPSDMVASGKPAAIAPAVPKTNGAPPAPAPVRPKATEVRRERFLPQQVAAARNYAFLSCRADALGVSLHVVREAHRRDQVSNSLYRLFEERYESIRREWQSSRSVLVAQTNDGGGLTVAMLDFIDEWLRSARPAAPSPEAYWDVVRPDRHCRTIAAKEAYIEAYFDRRDAFGAAGVRPR